MKNLSVGERGLNSEEFNESLNGQGVRQNTGETEDFLRKEVSKKIVTLALPISSPSLRSYYNSTAIWTVCLMMVSLNDFKTL